MPTELRYWDSACFLAWMKNEPDAAKCQGVIQQAASGAIRIVTSTWTLTEVIYLRGVATMAEADDGIIRAFFQQPYIALRPVTEEIGHLARQLVWKEAYSTKDAVHVATALDTRCAVMDTFDSSLILKGSPSGYTMRITQPNAPYASTLSFDTEDEPS